MTVGLADYEERDAIALDLRLDREEIANQERPDPATSDENRWGWNLSEALESLAVASLVVIILFIVITRVVLATHEGSIALY